MRSKGLDSRVKNMLKQMHIATREVEGTPAERSTFRFRFLALRLWSGCSALFFTLNPHDIHTPLLLVFLDGDGVEHGCKKISLDWDDAQMRAYYDEVLKDNPLRLHELAARHPAAAAKCVRTTFKMTMEILCNCLPSASAHPEKMPFDLVAARCEAGIYSHIRAYFGAVEPQMRKTEHLHMLLQILGFSHPVQYFSSGDFVDLFRRLWAYSASVCFHSPEAFAAHCGTGSGMDALRRAPLMPLGVVQRKMLSPEDVHVVRTSQLAARGIAADGAEVEIAHEAPFAYWVPHAYGSKSLTAEEWEALACGDVNTGGRKFGNHRCRSTVCHKNRGGQRGFCRMLFWRWRKVRNDKNKIVMQRFHGRQLCPRWNGVGLPPVLELPPHACQPALERHHHFHYKMTPGAVLGPRCNHDVGLLLRLPKNLPAHVSTEVSDVHCHSLRCGAASSGEGATPCAQTRRAAGVDGDVTGARAAESHAASSVLPVVGEDEPSAALAMEIRSSVQGCAAVHSPATPRGCGNSEAEESGERAGRASSVLPIVGEEEPSAALAMEIQSSVQGCAAVHSPATPRGSGNCKAEESGERADREASVALDECVGAMVETQNDHEFYCEAYASKEQPHAEGLLHTLYDSKIRHDQRYALRRLEDIDDTAADRARTLMQMLVSGTNRGRHVGFPEIYSYLGGERTRCSSHLFVHYSFEMQYRTFWAAADPEFRRESAERSDVVAQGEGGSDLDFKPMSLQVYKPTYTTYDYDWRPDCLELYPLYFFIAATCIQNRLPGTDGTWNWHEECDADGAVIGRHPCYAHRENDQRSWVKSRTLRDESGSLVPLRGKDLRVYDHYRMLRLTTPWRLPVLFGKMPPNPQSDSTAHDKARYAMFMMLMLRPWRSPERDFCQWFQRSDATDTDAVYNSIYTDLQLRFGVHALACFPPPHGPRNVHYFPDGSALVTC